MSKKNGTQPDPYRIDRLAFIPVPVKAIVIKWWFAGAVFYLVGMGLQLADIIDKTVILGIVSGMVNDLLINNIFRFMRTDKSIYDPYMMFPQKKFYTFFCNILYYLLISFGVTGIYILINAWAANKGLGEAGVSWLDTEPILYGVFTLLLDGICLGIKALIIKATQKTSK